MSRPIPIRTKTTSHCIPKEPLDSLESPPPLFTYSSSPDEPDEPLPLNAWDASIKKATQDDANIERLIADPGTKLLGMCCGGGCCLVAAKTDSIDSERVEQPDNAAYRSLQVNIEKIPTTLSGIPDIPAQNVSILPVKDDVSPESDEAPGYLLSSPSMDSTPQKTSNPVDTTIHPPNYVQPHPPYNLFSAHIFNARKLTKPGAEKRTYHFDLDVTDYPLEIGVDFKVGGAIGISAPNNPAVVEDVFNLLGIPRYLRDRRILLKTNSGRWPTVWGDDQAREIITTRRDLLTWCVDLESSPPTKSILRLLAEHASSVSEKKILLFLTSTEGQAHFCNLRTSSHITIPQLLHAFPSSQPPFEAFLSHLKQLMPRFYSLSADPHESNTAAKGSSRFIQIAVTVHEMASWNGDVRTGVGSGFLERQAQKFLDAEKQGIVVDLRIPIFKGLMANPLAREFVVDGPMLLIGAGVGVAPFRGFVQRRLRNANCVNKVWVLQGIRDSLLDELYSGEWGMHEGEVKKVVQSRKNMGQGKYVQDEVRAQADLVWYIINSLDGRVFVCGSSSGMGKGVENALIDVAIAKGNLDTEGAQKFWALKKEVGQYISETW